MPLSLAVRNLAVCSVSLTMATGMVAEKLPADYLKEQAERLSKEAEGIIKRTRSQVESAVDTASTSMAGAVKSAKSLL